MLHAKEHLENSRLVIIANNKTIFGDVEMKLKERLRTVFYIEVAFEEEGPLQTLGDISLASWTLHLGKDEPPKVFEEYLRGREEEPLTVQAILEILYDE